MLVSLFPTQIWQATYPNLAEVKLLSEKIVEKLPFSRLMNDRLPERPPMPDKTYSTTTHWMKDSPYQAER